MKRTSFIALVVEKEGTSEVIRLHVFDDVGKRSVMRFKNVVDN